MSALVLLNLLNKLGKAIKCEAYDFYKFNHTAAGMLDSIYHMTLKKLKSYFWRENVRISPYACVKSVIS